MIFVPSPRTFNSSSQSIVHRFASARPDTFRTTFAGGAIHPTKWPTSSAVKENWCHPAHQRCYLFLPAMIQRCLARRATHTHWRYRMTVFIVSGRRNPSRNRKRIRRCTTPRGKSKCLPGRNLRLNPPSVPRFSLRIVQICQQVLQTTTLACRQHSGSHQNGHFTGCVS